MIKIYNSLTNKLEDFIPIAEHEVKMYVCGPTVYNYMHIGNSRPVIFFDVVARFFRYMGYHVTFVSNFTDIDDKIINRAKEENSTEEEVSERFIKEIQKTYRGLNALPHNFNPKVTENMDGIIQFIELLVKSGAAYVVDGDVYFDVLKVKEYGILSGQEIENLINGARIEQNERKHNPVDFTLWKETKDGRKWDSPWSVGRPGWHTECVVMIQNIFQGKIDIHGGGNDLKFPHHDNEVAQSICAYDHKIANYWMHNGRIDLSGEKMSKSLGNVVWANDLLEKVSYQVYRLMILNVPYRQLLNYKEELLTQATNDFEKIQRAYISLFRKLEFEYQDLQSVVIKNLELLAIKQEFIDAMSNDFNTANAITAFFKLVKFANMILRNKETSKDLLQETKMLFDEFSYVLGIEIRLNYLTEEEKDLIHSWEQARSEKDFIKADILRKKITEQGIVI